MTENSYLYTCAAHSIQGYVFSDEKLKEVVGASTLVDQIPRVLIEAAQNLTREQSVVPPTVLGKAAGMVTLGFEHRNEADAFARIAPFLLHCHAPGLPFTQAVTPIENGKLGEAMDAAAKTRRTNRNRPLCEFPEATGILERAARSGEPAGKPTAEKSDYGSVSAKAKAKLDCFGQGQGTHGLLARLLPENFEDSLYQRFPQDFTDFTKGEAEYIAIIHADINGLGNRVTSFLEGLDDKKDLLEAQNSYTQFSEGLTACGEAAVSKGLEGLLEKPEYQKSNEANKAPEIPFRPLVAAGDDVTCVLHARDAFKFTQTVLHVLKEKAETLFKELGIQEPLYAAAGIAIIKPSYPFSRGYALAESLCEFTKQETRRNFSALAFHRLTTALIDDYPAYLTSKERHGLTNPDGLCLTMNPYALEANGEFPGIKQLATLAESAKKLPRGSLRGFCGRLQSQPGLAEKDWKRLFEFQSRKTQPKVALQDFRDALTAIVPPGSESGQAPAFAHENRTPIFDALEWNMIHPRESEQPANSTPEPEPA